MAKTLHIFITLLYIYTYKVPLRDGVDMISRGRRRSKRGSTGVPMICTGMSYTTVFALLLLAVCFVYLA